MNFPLLVHSCYPQKRSLLSQSGFFFLFLTLYYISPMYNDFVEETLLRTWYMSISPSHSILLALALSSTLVLLFFFCSQFEIPSCCLKVVEWSVLYNFSNNYSHLLVTVDNYIISFFFFQFFYYSSNEAKMKHIKLCTLFKATEKL